MSQLKHYLLKRALARSLKKLAPAQFKYDTSNDYYVPVLKRSNNPNGILVDSLDGEIVSGRIWDGSTFEEPIQVSLAELRKTEIEVTRFFGSTTVKYSTLKDFWIGETTYLAWRFSTSERLRQIVFNSTTRFRHDRIDVLKKLVSDHLKPANDVPINAILGDDYHTYTTLFEMAYGQRAFGHPSYREEIGRFEFVLRSLVTTNDLESDDQLRYRVTPQALVTIADYEQAERMHEDNVRHNKRILWLTIILSAATLIQAWVAYSGHAAAP